MENFWSHSGAQDTRPPSGTDNSRPWGTGLSVPSMGLLPVSHRCPPKGFWKKSRVTVVPLCGAVSYQSSEEITSLCHARSDGGSRIVEYSLRQGGAFTSVTMKSGPERPRD